MRLLSKVIAAICLGLALVPVTALGGEGAATQPEFRPLEFTPKTTANGASAEVIEVGLLAPKGVQDCYSFVDLDRTVLLWVRMDSVDGNTIMDLSSYAQRGMVSGDVIKDGGKFGKTATFSRDGKAGQITFDPNNLHTLKDSACTVSFWMKSPDYGLDPEYHKRKGEDGKLLNYTTSQVLLDASRFRIHAFGATRGRCLVLGFGIGVWPRCNGTQIGAWGDEFSHVAWVLDPTGDRSRWRKDSDGCVRLCVNSKWIPLFSEGAGLRGPLAPWPVGGPPTPLKIGGSFDGSLSDIIFFKRALSERELRSLYLASKLFDVGDGKDNPYENGFIGLPAGEHTFRGNLVDTKGNVYRTKERTVTVTTPAPKK